MKRNPLYTIMAPKSVAFLGSRGHLDALTRVHRILVEEGHFEDQE